MNQRNHLEAEFIFLIVIFQIVVLINSSTAGSYILREQNSNLNKSIIENGKNFSAFDKFGGLVLNFLSISQIGIVSATEVNQCCLKMKNGAKCQDIPFSSCGNCDGSCEPYLCKQSASCSPGCCVNEKEGTCSANSPMADCENNGGLWKTDKSCNIKECQAGCCKIDSVGQIVTKKRCEYLAKEKGSSFEFDGSIINNYVCKVTAEKSSVLGACVINSQEGKSCKLVTEVDCLKLNGNSNQSFYVGMLCSNPTIRAMDINCIPQFKTNCINGKDEVYWFDSCGNRENIYDSDKIKSWNGGMILEKDKSCNLDGFSNVDKCGNCNFAKDSICSDYKVGRDVKKPAVGNKICARQTCNYEGKTYLNGESWCVYDTPEIGNGQDWMGSRHWKYSCVEGEVNVEGCSDYRNAICAEKKFKDNETGITKNQAECVVNNGQSCLSDPCAEGNPFCDRWQIDIDEGFWFDISTPKFPPGFDSSNSESASSAEDTCGIATQTCTEYYLCDKCVYNCNCEEDEAKETMAAWCNQLGDCEPSMSISDGISYNIEKGISLNEYKNTNSESSINSGKDSGGNTNGENGICDSETEAKKSSSGGGGFLGCGIECYFVIPLIFRAIKYVVDMFTECKKITKKEVEFTCVPQQPIASGDNCKMCNADPLRPCTKYRCQSLGAACILKDKDSTNPVCVAMDGNDKKEPIIMPWQKALDPGYKYMEVQGTGFQIRTDDGKCVPEFTKINFGLETEKLTNCKYDIVPDKKFKEMQNFGKVGFINNHADGIIMPSLSSLKNLTILENNSDQNYSAQFLRDVMDGKYKIFVKCQDVWGNTNSRDFVVDVCVNKGPDLTPPKILDAIPKKDSYLKANVSSAAVTFYVNEPAECKYDYGTKPYDLLTYSLECQTNLWDYTPLGWRCNGTVQNATSAIYVKCRDQPWEVESKRMTQSEAYEYHLLPSEGDLRIIQIIPENGKVIIQGSEPFSVDLKATIAGGVDGTAECKYSLNNGPKYLFFETNRAQQSQTFDAIMAGDYKVGIFCKDEAGNVVNATTRFSLQKDISYPILVRSFKVGNNLDIETSELASCRFSTSGCGQIYSNSTSMSTGYSFSHRAESSAGTNYFIKCEDMFGNENPACYNIAVVG